VVGWGMSRLLVGAHFYLSANFHNVLFYVNRKRGKGRVQGRGRSLVYVLE
jgi:hypothetical protein